MSGQVVISECYVLVIDTDHFAGPFAEALCAFCTGFYGERAGEDAKDMSAMYYGDLGIEDDAGPKGLLADDKNPIRDLVFDQQDEAGTWSPCVVWPSRLFGTSTEGKYARLDPDNCDNYNYPAGFSVGIFLLERPADHQRDCIMRAANRFFHNIYPEMKGGTAVKIECFRLIHHRKTAEEIAF